MNNMRKKNVDTSYKRDKKQTPTMTIVLQSETVSQVTAGREWRRVFERRGGKMRKVKAEMKIDKRERQYSK